MKATQGLVLQALVLLMLCPGSVQNRELKDMTSSKRWVVRARCQAHCNQMLGYQERLLQINIFDNYLPFLCLENRTKDCSECSRVCDEGDPFFPTCVTNCSSQACLQGCAFLREVHREESASPFNYTKARFTAFAARNLTVSKPSIICSYTEMLNASSTPRSLMRVRWNVHDVTGASTSIPLAFVVAVTSEHNPNSWHIVGKTNFSVIPILNLMPETKYKIKVLAVHASGYVNGTVDSDWIQTPPVSTHLASPTNFRVTRQYVRGASLRALIEWEPPRETGGCFFRLYAMPPQGTYDSMETQFWGELRYELRSLQFSSEYSLEVYNFDENFDMHSTPANLSFRTADCLSATEFNYNICPPEKPENVSIRSTAMYVDGAEHPVSDILVTWDPPRYIRHHNAISNYTLSYRKTPDIHNVRLIAPHHGKLVLPGTATNSTIHGCHWDSVYEIYLTAMSPGGRSKEFHLAITLGNGYAEYYETSEYSENKDPDNEDKTVQYATAAPVLVGVIAVVVCLLYRRRIKARRKSAELRDSSHREEINPLYETTVTKEDATLLVADEYEIDYSALHFTQTVGEGAFGKVMKAELNLSVSFSYGALSAAPKEVAVKMLKEHATPDERRNLLLEIDAMKQLGQHQNIVSIIACVTSAPRLCLVMHYCPLGDLRNYLRNRRIQNSKNQEKSSSSSTSASGPTIHLNSGDSGISYASNKSGLHKAREKVQAPSYNRNTSTAAVSGESATTSSRDNTELLTLGSDTESISQTTLLSFARQIALGMEYLAQRKFIHRDLAARNILLYSHRQLKISDFGLARDVYETNVYQPTSARKLPYKWMPIESIFDQVFTIKSDVWSFGIVLWEIVTLGGSPYPGIPNKDLFRLLKEGYRMEKPENCSPEIYKMMLSCWHPRPEDRPSFTELRTNLERSLEVTESYIDLNIAVSEDYYHHDAESSDGADPFGSARTSSEDSHHCQELESSQTAIADVHERRSFHGDAPSAPPRDDISTLTRKASLLGYRPKSLPTVIFPDIDLGSGSVVPKPRSLDACIGNGRPCCLDNSQPEVARSAKMSRDLCQAKAGPVKTATLPDSSGSSTDLTCDCESPVSLSDVSVTSDSKAHVQHAPSLTYGLISLLGKTGQLRRGKGRDERQSLSLTEVSMIERVGMDVDHFDLRPGRLSYAQL